MNKTRKEKRFCQVILFFELVTFGKIANRGKNVKYLQAKRR